jgi:hypothetical protein
MTQKNVDSSKILLKTSTRTAQIWWVLAVFSSLTVFPVTAVIATQSALAQAKVSVNSALRLYGNAVNSRLCKRLSPANQNLWVCELTGSNPDIHLTFNDKTNLHITVRRPGCEGKAWIVGNWPRGLVLNQHEPREICKVNVVNYVKRLNDVREERGCKEAFLEAKNRGRIDESVANSYIERCKQFPK